MPWQIDPDDRPLTRLAVARVYYMKEDLQQIWGWGSDRQAAEWHLKSWIEMARNSGIGMLLKFTKTLEKRLDGILAYFYFNVLSAGPS